MAVLFIFLSIINKVQTLLILLLQLVVICRMFCDIVNCEFVFYKIWFYEIIYNYFVYKYKKIKADFDHNN